MSGSPKMTKRLPLPVFFSSPAIWRSAFMRALQNRDAAEVGELRRVGLVVERAGDQHIEAGVACLARCRHQIRAGNGAEFWADEDSSALLRR